ncbi:MAG: acetyl-CoA C-acetyltransferase [Bacteroidales bacterium]|jgi:acetyl-CoA C-acetyltransferase|nr:acetyl-CoA C-acetyltransferase [Bacteroidales bacterium]HOL96890.1 acetyl-CoA C-acetyltransferase [Bacteroidales bacterium]HOM36829.1 acetyl-CoA C-acetyltransferase [Bacteroidales bacterium]HPD24300.1 acetyl-CoA C-acetyltransferase [Bacteroidales bacterium]HRS98447.1 acetyl-CoA C-acetyltransferase [Bacteroidales bacterium]
MKKVYIVAAKRTAIGKFGGSLAGFSASDLGAAVIKNIIENTQIDPAAIDEVIVGNILSAGQGQGVGRQCAIKAGIPVEVPAYSLNMVCGSGMKSVSNAFISIQAGMSDLVLAGGTENMSQASMLLPHTVRNGVKMGNFTVMDHMITDGLWDAYNDYHMGNTAENIAEKYNISREEQDKFAADSQIKAAKAQDAGNFDKEIVPINIVTKKETIVFDKDEYINRSTNLEKLSALRPAFKKDGTVTAGNASGINDGASFVLVASEDALKKYNLTPLVEIVAVGQGGVDPKIMGMGPVPAIKNALKNANLKLTDIEVLELNEAFAAQSLGVIKQLCRDHGVDIKFFEEKCNKNGGAIALGHPIGASGNRIIVTLIHEMKRSNNTYGLASLCIGGGMGTAIILKNV